MFDLKFLILQMYNLLFFKHLKQKIIYKIFTSNDFILINFFIIRKNSKIDVIYI